MNNFFNRLASWFASNGRIKGEIDKSLKYVEDQLVATIKRFNEPN